MKGGLVWFDGCSVLPLLFLIETSGEGDLESGEESIALNQENETPPVMDCTINIVDSRRGGVLCQQHY